MDFHIDSSAAQRSLVLDMLGRTSLDIFFSNNKNTADWQYLNTQLYLPWSKMFVFGKNSTVMMTFYWETNAVTESSSCANPQQGLDAPAS